MILKLGTVNDPAAAVVDELAPAVVDCGGDVEVPLRKRA